MPAATVTTGGGTLVAADTDQWRTVVVQNLGPTNFIAIEVGSTPTTANGFQVAAGGVSPPIPLGPGQLIGAIANVASCDVRYLVI